MQEVEKKEVPRGLVAIDKECESFQQKFRGAMRHQIDLSDGELMLLYNLLRPELDTCEDLVPVYEQLRARIMLGLTGLRAKVAHQALAQKQREIAALATKNKEIVAGALQLARKDALSSQLALDDEEADGIMLEVDDDDGDSGGFEAMAQDLRARAPEPKMPKPAANQPATRNRARFLRNS